MVAWNNILSYAVAIGMAGFVLVERVPITYKQAASAQTPSQVSPTADEETEAEDANSLRPLKFNLSVSDPQDLRVKQGDTISAGQVLADRVQERTRLANQRKALELSLQQIESAPIAVPPPPMPVPAVEQLPPVSYTEEDAAIAAAAMRVQQAERAFQLQQQNLKSAPLEESSAVQRALVSVNNRQRIVDNQKRKIDAVAQLQDLPPEVMPHEQEVLKQLEAELQQAQAEYQQAQSKLVAASQTESDRLQQLSAALEQTRADQQLAIAKLQSKKDQRSYVEYEASVTAARRAEERNQAEQNYSRQLQEAEQQKRDRNFQIAQIQAKIAEVDNQLAALSTVTSPYAGFIRRLKVTGQNEQNLLVEITLATNSSSIGTGVPSTGRINPPSSTSSQKQ